MNRPRVRWWYGGRERRFAVSLELWPRFLLFLHLGRRIARVWYGTDL